VNEEDIAKVSCFVSRIRNILTSFFCIIQNSVNDGNLRYFGR